jgi:4-carboxymuconolactone decarboxylase
MHDRVLSGSQEALIGVAVAMATRDAGAVREALERARGVADAREVDEVILQSHLFVGFPDALNALVLWREIGGGEAAVEPSDLADSWAARGDRVCASVYGANYGKLRENVQALHPDLDAWMVVGGYGRVIGREGLDLVTRELCIAALLAAWNTPRQLHSHLRGALNVGATVAQVDRAVELACAQVAPAATDTVRTLWASVRGAAAR